MHLYSGGEYNRNISLKSVEKIVSPRRDWYSYREWGTIPLNLIWLVVLKPHCNSEHTISYGNKHKVYYYH